MNAVRAAMGSRYAGFAAVLLAGLAACQGVEFGFGVKPSVPPPDSVVVKQVEDARAAVAEAERKANEAAQLAADAEAARASAVATAADLERKVAAGEATRADLEQVRRRATEAATEAAQAKERAERARAWTDDFAARVTAANDRLAKAESAWREAESAGLKVEGPKETTPWGLLSWAISTALLVVLNEKRKREAHAVLEAAKRESGEVVARQDDAPFVGSGGKLEPEHRLADTPSRLDSIEAALAAAGVLKRT
ncbi:MAG: hypothetical protein JNM10_09460 [Planctomycetia bacterium]|nr:hypothetical protein [Planctomycetia bacterium]